MYGRSNQYNYKDVDGSASYDQYGSNTGAYDAQYGNQYDNTYETQYDNSQYGSSGAYDTTESYGRQTRTMNRSPTTPEIHLTATTSPTRPGYGSPVPRRNNSPGMQIPVPNLQSADTGKRMDRYRSCSPGRRNAMVGTEEQQQQMAGSNMLNNNQYGRYDSRNRSPNRNIHPQSGVETPSTVRPSTIKGGAMNANAPTIRLDGQIHPSSTSYSQNRGRAGMQKSSYGSPMAGSVNSDLMNFFNTVDTDRSGRISWNELQTALTDGDWIKFDERTCRLMISMFDAQWSGSIDAQEFSALWAYMIDWQALFDGFDSDRSGTIDSQELYQALLTFGYGLPSHFSSMLISIYDKAGTGSIRFDAFINACVMLKLVTKRFEERDPRNTKRIQINMEQFVEIVLDTCLVNL